MSDDLQNTPNDPEKVDRPQPPADGTGPEYHVLPYKERMGEQELYSFREAMMEPEPAGKEDIKKAQRKRSTTLLLIGLAAVIGALGLLLVPRLIKPAKAPALYVDMGARQFDPAGLSGRLIVRWEGSAAYQLFVDPSDQGMTAEFQAVAMDPPHPLSVDIRLHDSSGVVVCQKEILLPSPAQPAGSPDHSQALKPRQSPTGDAVENIEGTDGQIAEITVSGSLPCSQEAYQRLSNWDFSTNFPGGDDQEEWLRHENNLAGAGKQASKGGRGAQQQAQKLSTPIEGDDVIVGDNPSKGTVITGGGRVFLIGSSGMRNRAPEWQVFPAAIHFRCDKTGACVLTRSNSRNSLQARLMH
ncbi:MAG: hypothetical protein ABSF23_05170 [Terracidiphilus sp.]|jgi:hypothetical protein